MSRYFTRRALWVADEDADTVDVAGHIPTVSDHKATDTGLLDINGEPIFRAPNSIGFLADID